jgi:predicted DCC family thiol-disulfide oxidoreductase YuxK
MTHIANKPLILFDGDCGLCNKLVQFVIRRDKGHKFLFAPLQSKFGQAFLRQDGIFANDYESFIYITNNEIFKKSTAAFKLLKDLGGIWKVPYLFIILPKPLRDWVYKLVAKNRFRVFGKQNYCIMPSEELRGQFLE